MKLLASLEGRLAVILLGCLLLPTFAVGWLGYGATLDTIRADKVQNVGRVADAKQEEFVTILRRTNARAAAFLAGVAERCVAERKDIDRSCALVALQSFVRSERALGAVLSFPGGGDFIVGQSAASIADLSPFKPGQLVRFSPASPGTERSYDVAAILAPSGLRVVVTFPVALIQGLFGTARDLGESGETFLADENGFFVTNARYPSSQGHSHPIATRPMQDCLAGHSGEVLDQDYRDVAIIHGYRHIGETGGGCIMAHFDQGEAFAPLRAMQWRIGAMTLAFCVLASGVALVIARGMVTPIAKLTQATRDFAHGRASPALDIKAAGELGELARAFTAMRISVTEGERTLRNSVLQADLANRSKTEFLANMSHELRTPLNAILGFSDVLRSGAVVPVEDRVKGYCEDIYSAGEHLLALINDILDIAKIESGHVELDREDIDIADAMAKCLIMVGARANEGNVALLSTIPDDLPPLSADRTRFNQILLNLLSNAVKFTPLGGTVSIGVVLDPAAFHFSVSDTGIGIAPEHIARVTEPFYQVESVTNRRFEGTGLGLALVKEMVGLHGGSLEIHSQLGKGTTIMVSLPR